MSSLGERLVLLAAVALLAGVVVLAVSEQRTDTAVVAVGSAPAPGGWNRVFAGSRGAAGDAQRTTCGQLLTNDSLGVTHPVLPCGAKLVVRRDDVQVLTEVIDNQIAEPGRQLEVTAGLAEMLGLEGTEEVDWRFATGTTG